MRKKTEFRKGQKMEIGFDLKRNHTGKNNGGPFTTEEGELLSNFMENGDYLNTKKPNN